MKRITVIIGLLCLGLWGIGMGTNAQIVINVFNLDEVLKAKPIDETRFTVQYQTTFVSDSLQPEDKGEETMMLKVGDKCSIYYSYTKYLCDSILEADKAAGASKEVIDEHLRQYFAKVNIQVYKNYPAGKTTTLDALATSRFRCEEKEERPGWTLLPDTMTFLSYPCQKATCHFKGRDYEVWYTPEIPRSDGPWKLYGLPGLILKAQDSRGHYTFTCTGIELNHRDNPILFGGGSYEPIDRKSLQKVYERYAADPIGYIALTAPYIKVNMTGEDGKPFQPKNTPHNPIELDTK